MSMATVYGKRKSELESLKESFDEEFSPEFDAPELDETNKMTHITTTVTVTTSTVTVTG